MSFRPQRYTLFSTFTGFYGIKLKRGVGHTGRNTSFYSRKRKNNSRLLLVEHGLLGEVEHVLAVSLDALILLL